jgi:hypothetical protein
MFDSDIRTRTHSKIQKGRHRGELGASSLELSLGANGKGELGGYDTELIVEFIIFFIFVFINLANSKRM